MGDEASSLSAVLLDDSYYAFLHAGKQELEGLSILGPEYIILLKARAWSELAERKEQGEYVDSKDIRKHKNDVFRLYQVITLENHVGMIVRVKQDMGKLHKGQIKSCPLFTKSCLRRILTPYS